MFNFRMPKGFDRTLHFSMLLLYLFGMLMMASSIGPKGVNAVRDLVVKQVGYFIVGYYLLAFQARMYHPLKMRKLVDTAYVVVMIAMVVPIIFYMINPDSGASVNGTHAWIPLFGIMTIQPSEFLKVVFILKLSYVLYDVNKVTSKAALKRKGFKRPFKLAAITLFAVLIQLDLGTLIIMTSLFWICYLSSTSRYLKTYQNKILAVSMVGIGFLALIIISPAIQDAFSFIGSARLSRITILANPTEDPLGNGYQLLNSLMAMARGGLTGTGLGQSLFKNGYIPVAESDFIFVIIIEELGLLGFFAVMIPNVMMITILIRYARLMVDDRGRIVLIGTVGMIVMHLFVNIGGVTGLIPMTGVPLFLISAGGSSLWAIMSAIGLSQAIISKYKKGEIR